MPDISSIIKDYQTRFGLGHPYTEVQTTGTSYGPSVTRITHTPIDFTTHMRKDDDLGEYVPGTNHIDINPVLSDDLGNTIRHESTHALLDWLTPEHSQQLVQSSPNYDTIAHKIYNMSSGSPQPWSEAAAYMAASPQSQILGVSDQQHDQFLQGLRDQLTAVHPSLGATFQKLIDSGRKPIQRGPSENFNNYTGQ